MANQLFSFFKQSGNTYEVKDAQARSDINDLNTDLNTVEQYSPSSGIFVVKAGHICMLTIVATLSLNNDQIIFTLNSGYRPKTDIYADDFRNGVRVHITPSGDVKAQVNSTATYSVRLSACFVV